MRPSDSTRLETMRDELNAAIGFARPRAAKPARQRVAALELVASLTLALSTIVAATVVTIGFARADALNLAHADGGTLGVALLIGALFAGMGGLTALMAQGRPPQE